ncbi:MAG: protein kinase [Parachlamydia sp.]|nr:protein kinase [Parachlamydia sp.]
MGFYAGSLNKSTESQFQTSGTSHKSAQVVEKQLSAIPEQDPQAPSSKINLSERSKVSGVFERTAASMDIEISQTLESPATTLRPPNAASESPTTTLESSIGLGSRVSVGQPSAEKPLPHPETPPMRNPIGVTIIRSSQPRPKTFTKEGQELIESAAPTTRIQLNGVVGEQFQLALTEEPKELAPGEEAAVGLSDDRVATLLVEENGHRFQVSVKLDEISDRLLISKDLDEEARKGQLDLLFQRKEAKLQNLPKLLGDYQKLFNDHYQQNPEGLIGQLTMPKGTVLESGLNARQMMKVVRAFHRAELLNPAQEGQDLNPDKQNKYDIQNVRVLYRREDGTLKMTRYDVEDALCENIYGAAVRIAQLDLNKMMVAKVVRAKDSADNFTPIGQAELFNEFTLLRKIHKDGKVRGIQDAPHAYVAINENAGPYAMVGTEYAGNTMELVHSPIWKNTNLETKLDCCTQILEGGANLEEMGILHLDQKPQNVFYLEINEPEKKRFLFEIADFGGASDQGPPEEVSYTPEYMPTEEKDHPTHKTDVYQRGVILFYYLTNGQQPWPTKRVFFSDENKFAYFPNLSDTNLFNKYPLLDQNVPEPIIDFIREMCDPDPAKRPGAAEAYQHWNDLISSYLATR